MMKWTSVIMIAEEKMKEVGFRMENQSVSYLAKKE
jgi:hypothetical protein